jgi:hypothetical protein
MPVAGTQGPLRDATRADFAGRSPSCGGWRSRRRVDGFAMNNAPVIYGALMGASSAYLTAVLAGAMTAGIGAASIVASPEKTESVAVAEADLAAIEIPIIDIGPTPGPLSIWRQLSVLVGLDPLTAGLIQHAGNTYNLPGLNTLFDSDSHLIVQAVREAGEYVDFGLESGQGQEGAWELLGGIATGSSEVDSSRSIHFRGLTGGTGGIGASLYGTLGNSSFDRDLTFLGSALNSSGTRTVGDFNGELALLPWDGFNIVGGGSEPPTDGGVPTATLIDTNRLTTFNLGSLTGAATSDVTLDGGAGLCLGSAKASCGGNTAFLAVGAPVEGGLTLAGRNIISGDFSTNRVVSTLGNGQFSVQGAIGGTFTVGNLEIGRPIPIDIQIPRASSMLSSASARQTSSVRSSFVAVPRSRGSDNGTASTGRHAARDAVNSAISEVSTAVKTAVSNATQGKPRHAKPDADDAS